jgi:hypothetical protein
LPQLNKLHEQSTLELTNRQQKIVNILKESKLKDTFNSPKSRRHFGTDNRELGSIGSKLYLGNSAFITAGTPNKSLRQKSELGESVQNPPMGIGKKKGSHNPSTMPSLDFLSR